MEALLDFVYKINVISSSSQAFSNVYGIYIIYEVARLPFDLSFSIMYFLVALKNIYNHAKYMHQLFAS